MKRLYLKEVLFENLLPDSSYSSVIDIPLSFFDLNSIKGIIIDMDNTLVSRREKIPSLVCLNWIDELKKSGIAICMVTNNSDINRIAEVSSYLGVIAVRRGLKPFNFVLKKVVRDFMKLKPEEIAMIGDQYVTDIMGANLMKMHSVYVDPLSYEKAAIGENLLNLIRKCICSLSLVLITNSLNAFSVLDDERLVHAESGERIKYYRVVNYSGYVENISIKLEDVNLFDGSVILEKFSCKKNVRLSTDNITLVPGEMKVVEIFFDEIPDGKRDFFVDVYFNDLKKTLICRNFVFQESEPSVNVEYSVTGNSYSLGISNCDKRGVNIDLVIINNNTYVESENYGIFLYPEDSCFVSGNIVSSNYKLRLYLDDKERVLE